MKELGLDVEAPLRGLRILVVDDGFADRAITCETLAMAGAVVSHGCDGHEGLKLATAQPFDAIILDIEMPGVNGFEMASGLRVMGIATPLYALTSLRIPPEDPRRKNFNISGWFQKPLNGGLLVRALSLPGRYAIRPQVHPDFDQETSGTGTAVAFDVSQVAAASPRILAVVRRFAEELDPMVQAITAAALGGDVESLKAQLHRLRGASGSCGFLALMSAVERWEDALDANRADEDGLYLIGLKRAADEGRSAFRQFLDTRGETPLDA